MIPSCSNIRRKSKQQYTIAAIFASILLIVRLGVLSNGRQYHHHRRHHEDDDAIAIESSMDAAAETSISTKSSSKSPPPDATIYKEATSSFEVAHLVHRHCSLDIRTMCAPRNIGLSSPCHSSVDTIDPAFATIMEPYASGFDHCRFKFHVNNASDLPVFDTGYETVTMDNVFDIWFRHFVEDLYVLSRVYGFLPSAHENDDSHSSHAIAWNSPNGKNNDYGSSDNNVDIDDDKDSNHEGDDAITIADNSKQQQQQQFNLTTNNEESSPEIEQYVYNFMHSLHEYLGQQQQNNELQIVIETATHTQTNHNKEQEKQQRTITLSSSNHHQSYSIYDLKASFQVAMNHYSSFSNMNFVDDTSIGSISQTEYQTMFHAQYLPLLQNAINRWMKIEKKKKHHSQQPSHKEIPKEQLVLHISRNPKVDQCLRQRYVDDMMIQDSCRVSIDLATQRLRELADERNVREGGNDDDDDAAARRDTIMVIIVLQSFSAVVSVGIILRAFIKLKQDNDATSISNDMHHHAANTNAIITTAQRLLAWQWMITLVIGTIVISLSSLQSSTTTTFHRYWIDLTFIFIIGNVVILFLSDYNYSEYEQHQFSSSNHAYELSNMMINDDTKEYADKSKTTTTTTTTTNHDISDTDSDSDLSSEDCEEV